MLFDSSANPGRPTNAFEAERMSRDFVEFYHHAAPFSAERLLELWQSCRTGRATEQSCRVRAEGVLAEARGDKDFDQLFDMQTDPDELVNLIEDPAHAAALAEMRAALADWMTRTGDIIEPHFT